VYDIFLVYTNGGINVNWFEIEGNPIEIPIGPEPSTRIPALIQAENYNTQSGVDTESTSDIGGGENVGFIDTGDYIEYQIFVPTSGLYKLDFRVASRLGGGAFDILQGGSVIGNVSVDSTGGWQNWVTLSRTVNLDAGNQTIRLLATNSGWNINWINFDLAEKEESLPTLNVEIEQQFNESGVII